MVRVIFFNYFSVFQAVLSSKPKGDSKLQDLKSRAQSLCEHQDLEESRRREVQQAVREVEEEWRRVLQEAEERLGQAEAKSALDNASRAFESQRENSQSWVRNQRQHLQSLSSDMQIDERLHVTKVNPQLLSVVGTGNQ